MLTPGTPALILAPMEGVTDAPMRTLLTEHGGFTFCVSEFLRISQDVPPARVFRTHVPELNRAGCSTPAGTPVQIQLLGGNAERLALSAQVAVTAGALGIDLNFGCPAPTVNRHDGGATLLKCPDRIETIIRAVRAAVPAGIPVSAKFRLGWDSHDPIHEIAGIAEAAGVSWITIHGRTKVQGYAPPAYWGPIAEVRKRAGVPVVANGDIWTVEDFKRCRDETGCEHFMIGRGAVADPFLASKIAEEMGNPSCGPGSNFTIDEKRDWIPLLERFTELCEPYASNPSYTLRRIKQWLRMSHVRKPLEWIEPVKRAQSLPEVFEFLNA